MHKTNGVKPLLIVKFATKSIRDRVLAEAKKLRNSTYSNAQHVYINPDLTPIQRKEFKALREKLRIRRAKGDRVIIKVNENVHITRNKD